VWQCGSVRQCVVVRQFATVQQCVVVRQFATVQQCGSTTVGVVVHASVCDSAAVWQCAEVCAAVSAVRQCGTAAVSGNAAVRQCVRQCGSVWQ
jgi:hypothetical protein